MAPFSASDAALEGFQVLRRHWRVVVGWAVFNLIATVMVIVVGATIGVGLVLSRTVDDSSLESVLGPSVATLAVAVVQLVLAVGLYRLLLRPQDPGFLHLRIGRDELRQAAVAIVMLCAGAAIIVAAYLLAQALQPVSGVASIGAAVIAGGVMLWLTLRFGLAAPLSFAERRIDFLGSWRLTRGRTAALFGMWLLNVCILAMLWVAGWVAMFVLGGLISGFGAAADADAGLDAHPGRFLLEAALSIMVTPVILILAQAPYVAAYKALAEPAPAEA